MKLPQNYNGPWRMGLFCTEVGPLSILSGRTTRTGRWGVGACW